MCYLLVIAAPESASPAIADISVGELSMWEERNASISMGVPDNYSLHAIGVAHHCSCGCVKTNRTEDSENNKKFIFASDAAKMIEMAARVARQLAFIVHWMSTDLDSEEFLVSFGPGISCSMLSQPQTSFELDQLVWVAG